MHSMCRSAWSIAAAVLLVAWPLAAREMPAISVLGVLVDGEALAGAHDVELADNLAFVAGKGGALAVIDVSDPARPKLAWSRRDPVAFTDAEAVLPLGDWLFVGTRDFLAVNIRNPREPVVEATVSDRSRIDRINGLARRGNLVFAASKDGWIDGFDITTPAKPKLAGALNVRARDLLHSPHDIDWLGEMFVVVDPAGFGRNNQPGQLAVYRCADDAGLPLADERWSLVGRVASPHLTGANRVRVGGGHAYIAASISPQAIDLANRQAKVAVVDLADPARPALVASVPFPESRGPNGLTLAGKVLFAAGGQTILAIDVSDPRHPQVLTSYRCNDAFRGTAGQDDAHDLVYRGGRLYTTGQVTHSFAVLAVNDPKIRRLAGE